MKLIVIFTFFTAMHVNAAVYAQKISISKEKISLEEALKLVKNQSGYDVFFNSKTIQNANPVTVSLKNASLEEALTKLFSGQPLTYVIDNHVIVVKEKEIAHSASNKADEVTISGRVVGEDGKPLPGVSILVVGKLKGVSTNNEGYYMLKILKSELPKDITFTMLGMKKQQYTIQGDRVLNVKMEFDANMMSEVVVNGYQTLQKKDMVGAVATVKLEDIENPAFTTVDKMLQGQVAGLIVTNASSRASATADVKIRGTATVLGNSAPLWVVDGIIQPDPIKLDISSDLAGDLNNIVGSQISWLNPSDINTITILKDASATAIYGSRASNGVIVITTNKGTSGKTRFNYRTNATYRAAPTYNQYNLMNSQERIKLSIDGFNAGVIYNNQPIKQLYTYEGLMGLYLDREITRDEFAKNLTTLETANTNWLDLLTQSSLSQTHNLNVSGGNDKVTYYSSLSYNNNKGTEIGDQVSRITGRLRVSAELSPKLDLDLNLAVTQSKADGLGRGINPLKYALETSRAMPAYDEFGAPLFYTERATYAYNGNTKANGLGYNFINERDNSYTLNQNLSINSSINFRWKIIKDLRYELVLGLSRNQTSNESFMGENTFYIANRYRGYMAKEYLPGTPEYKAAILPYGGELFSSNGSTTNYNVQNKLTYTKNFGEDHRLNALLVHELRSSKLSNDFNTVWGYSPERGQILFQPTAPSQLVPLGGSASYGGNGVFTGLYTGSWDRKNQTDNLASYLGSVAYTFKDRYTLNANIRSELTNRLNQDVSRRLEPIWSVGAGWNIGDEPMLKDQQKWLNNARLRASYGMQGNVLTNRSPNLIINQGSFDSNYGQFVSLVSSLPNPYLSREKTKNWNFGLDLRLFNFFTATFDYYSRSSAVVVNLPVPQENGLQEAAVNGGVVTNSGYEYSFTFSPIRKKDISLNLSVNGGKNFNKGGFSNVPDNLNVTAYLGGAPLGIVLKEGYDISSFWAFSYKGLDPATGRPLFNLVDKPASEVSDPTDYLVYVGKTAPDFSGGFSANFRYKNLTLASHFMVSLGRTIKLANPYDSFVSGFMPDPLLNVDKELVGRWSAPGDENTTSIPGLPYGGEYYYPLPDGESMLSYQMWGNTDIRTVSGNFIRCNNLSLTYNVKQAFLKKYGISDFGLTASASNIFVIASKDLNGFDPEIRNKEVTPKVFTLGLNIGF
ncbi:SusC/RagA family TonB-linked outer membrane protein [Pedobacter sp. MW01-1-1]|uniref:SusC/RagA family TonB-linked outer membrane protein n=1 Tax=Pedobacter sp. MW01-1-1 TaxID=3383027 RepID=UPI003FEDD7E6